MNQNEILYQFAFNLESDRLDFESNLYIGSITQILIYFFDTHLYKFKTIRCSVEDEREYLFYPIPDSIEKICIVDKIYIPCITSDLRNTPIEAIHHDQIFLLPKDTVEAMFHENKGKLIILPDFITYEQLKTTIGLPISSILLRNPKLHIITLHEYEQDIYKEDGVSTRAIIKGIAMGITKIYIIKSIIG